MSLKVSGSPLTREDNSSVTACRPTARGVMQLVIDIDPAARKAIAIDVLGRDDQPQFSKMVGGTRPFDLDHLDALPRDLRVEWLKRYAEADGLQVRDLDVIDIAHSLVDAFAQVAHIARLFQQVGRPRMAPGPDHRVAEDRRTA